MALHQGTLQSPAQLREPLSGNAATTAALPKPALSTTALQRQNRPQAHHQHCYSTRMPLQEPICSRPGPGRARTRGWRWWIWQKSSQAMQARPKRLQMRRPALTAPSGFGPFPIHGCHQSPLGRFPWLWLPALPYRSPTGPLRSCSGAGISSWTLWLHCPQADGERLVLGESRDRGAAK